jgi:lipopolysaccharide export LptBFGC system permease protein LptF
MSDNFPVGLFAIIVSLYLFYHYNNKARDKRNERREKLEETRQQFWDSFNKKESKDLSK